MDPDGLVDSSLGSAKLLFVDVSNIGIGETWFFCVFHITGVNTLISESKSSCVFKQNNKIIKHTFSAKLHRNEKHTFVCTEFATLWSLRSSANSGRHMFLQKTCVRVCVLYVLWYEE